MTRLEMKIKLDKPICGQIHLDKILLGPYALKPKKPIGYHCATTRDEISISCNIEPENDSIMPENIIESLIACKNPISIVFTKTKNEPCINHIAEIEFLVPDMFDGGPKSIGIDKDLCEQINIQYVTDQN